MSKLRDTLVLGDNIQKLIIQIVGGFNISWILNSRSGRICIKSTNNHVFQFEIQYYSSLRLQ